MRWSLRRPLWVQASASAATLAVLVGLAWVIPLLSLCLLPLVWHYRHHGQMGLINPGGSLLARQGQWQILDNNGKPCLTEALPERLWQGSTWLSLRLKGRSAGGAWRHMDATVWKASTTPVAWRSLRQQGVRLAARASYAGGAQ